MLCSTSFFMTWRYCKVIQVFLRWWKFWSSALSCSFPASRHHFNFTAASKAAHGHWFGLRLGIDVFLEGVSMFRFSCRLLTWKLGHTGHIWTRCIPTLFNYWAIKSAAIMVEAKSGNAIRQSQRQRLQTFPAMCWGSTRRPVPADKYILSTSQGGKLQSEQCDWKEVRLAMILEMMSHEHSKKEQKQFLPCCILLC